ncbi:MAG: exodeoxyribonuclease III [Oligoflexia bacterium]|nr:exodeoxyribonuclease III [Oligoflexia bacterium]
MSKILTWNVNGIRAAQKGGFLKWFAEQSADVICVQETKARPEQLDEQMLHPEGYHSFWHSAEKPGYSGTAIYSKRDPLEVRYGIGIPEIDREGRVIVAEYADFAVVNAYFPNSQRDHARLGYKLEFCDAMLGFLEHYRNAGKSVVLCGDLNIAHRPIDLKNPRSNENNAGYLPEERAWMDKVLHPKGPAYVDAFRHFTPDPDHYTWWSYRPGVREKNIGWRLDYFVVNPEFRDRLKRCEIQSQVRGSDHCPVRLELKS